MGGTYEHCGYPCVEPPGWTIATCPMSPNSSWSYDGACKP
jgi:hypothetical protein